MENFIFCAATIFCIKAPPKMFDWVLHASVPHSYTFQLLP